MGVIDHSPNVNQRKPADSKNRKSDFIETSPRVKRLLISKRFLRRRYSSDEPSIDQEIVSREIASFSNEISLAVDATVATTRLRSCHFLTCREHAVTRVDKSKFSDEQARRRLRAQENRKKHEVAPCARVKELSSARHSSLQESKSYLLKRLRTAPGSGSREYGGQSVAPGASARKKALIRSRGRFCALPSLAALPPSLP